MWHQYSLTRTTGEDVGELTSLSVSHDDAVMCAHLLAAGFNTMSRNMLGDFALAVVDRKTGIVQYEGKYEQIKRDDPWSVSQSFNFEASTAGDTLLTFFGLDEQTATTLRGNIKADEPQPSKYAHIAREDLERSHAELQDVRAALETVGVETIPPSAGVRELIRRNDFEYSARTAYEQRHNEELEAGRAEMISFVKRAHAKKVRIQAAGEPRPELDDRWRGMLDVLAKFLVVTGEADPDEGHAVARRLCEVNDSEF